MKKMKFFHAAALLIAATSCQNKSRDDVVCETYLHRYGVEMSADDWSSRGKDGCVVSTRKDGVIETKNYEGGLLHGEATYTFPHLDTVQKKEYYNNGQISNVVEHHPDGIPHKQTTYQTPQSQSVVIWYDNGVPHAKEEYENGALVQGQYFNPANQQESSVTNQSGQRLNRDRYGQLISQDQIENGQMISSTTFHPNGSPSSVSPYANGVVHGQRKTFLPGGEPSTIEMWEDGVQQGNTIVYKNGEKYADVPYKFGKKNGVEQRYRNGQDPVEQVTWENDQRHGPSHAYGNTTWYFQDKQVNKAQYDALRNQ